MDDAAAQASLQTIETLPIGTVWIAMSIGMVVLMQLGFLQLESGLSRSSSAVSTAIKNLMDLAIVITLFWFAGALVAFASVGEALPWLADNPDGMLTLAFQTLFCATAVTIVSGAVAERCNLNLYVLMSVIMAVVIYPVVARAVWGDTFLDGNTPLLGDMGFLDFAGSSVVHSTGGWVALAMIIVIGPRIARFGQDGEVNRLGNSSPIIAAAGGIVMVFGWLGFNGGSALHDVGAVPHIISNTLQAAAGGLLVGYLWAVKSGRGVIAIERLINGMLGGLVAVTAGCDLLGPLGAIIVGIVGGLVANAGNDLILYRLKLDDVVGAVGVHGFAGAAGTILFPLFVAAEKLPADSRLDQVFLQAGGVIVIFVWVFSSAFAALFVLKRLMRVRVSKADEAAGIDSTIHGVVPEATPLERSLTMMTELNSADPEDLKLLGVDTDEIARLRKLMAGIRSDALRETRERVRALQRGLP